MKYLVMNSGSSSLKVSVADEDEIVYKTQIDQRPTDIADERWRQLFAEIREASGDFDVVLHRVVQGGWIFGGPRLATPEVIAQIKSLTPLAPVHQPPTIATLERTTALLPGVLQTVHFDTAFHQTMPLEAYTYAVPEKWRTEFRVRRYGAHGLAHAYNARKTAEVLGRPVEDLKIVSCHLGSGASLCAVQGGRSVDTTMGMTPLEGLVMGTRSGSIDPEIIPWVMDHTGMSAREVVDQLEFASGLKGLTGTDHMGHIMDRYRQADQHAYDAVRVWLHRTTALIAAMVAAMDGVDAIAISGGVGENGADVRKLLADRLGFLGVSMDREANDANVMDTDVATADSVVRFVVVQTREDLTMIREARELLLGSGDVAALI